VTRDEFIDRLDAALRESVPRNHEEFTKDQLVTYIFDALFSRAERAGLVPSETRSETDENIILRPVEVGAAPAGRQRRIDGMMVVKAPPHVRLHHFDHRERIPFSEMARILHRLVEDGYAVQIEEPTPLTDDTPLDGLFAFQDASVAGRERLAGDLRRWADELDGGASDEDDAR
jgi:hypothetical protein